MTTKLRALFVGTLDFSHYCLDRLLKLPVEVVGIVTDAPGQNTFNSDYRDLGSLAASADLPVHTDVNLSDPFAADWVQELDVDVIFVFGWSRMIADEVLSRPRFGGVGSHPSPLPVGRGRHPIMWTLIKGNLDDLLPYLGDEWLELIDRGRRASYPELLSQEAWADLFVEAGLDVIEIRPQVTWIHAHLWDVGLRPLSPVLIRMAQGLDPEDRCRTKEEWIDIWLRLLRPFDSVAADFGEPRPAPECLYVATVS